ncbi:MAG: hypothetical protein HFJ24_02760 [Clostridia bacterium]|nr:hypothetical protein [Clostridia bacterium]MCI9274952.1 hypothetical protein [Clostridia bacterium]
MRPLIFMTVGYIIGFIWGLYFNINIVPIIFLLIFILYVFRKKIVKLGKYKTSLALMIIFMIISNIQTLYLENKFSTLYQDNQEIEIIGVITKEGQEKEYRIEYEIKVESINGDEKYKNTKLILYVKNKEKIEYGKKVKLIR